MDTLKQTLIELEEGFWKDAGTDGNFYERHMADDGIMILPFTAGRMGKDATVSSVQKAAKWKDFTIDDVEVRTMDEKHTVLVYTTLAHHEDDSEYRAHIATTYRKSDDSWQLLIHQQTPIFM